jgi:hypothetical protein
MPNPYTSSLHITHLYIPSIQAMFGLNSQKGDTKKLENHCFHPRAFSSTTFTPTCKLFDVYINIMNLTAHTQQTKLKPPRHFLHIILCKTHNPKIKNWCIINTWHFWSCQKWFENPHLEIISQTLNNWNYVHIWINPKLIIVTMLTHLITRLIMT